MKRLIVIACALFQVAYSQSGDLRGAVVDSVSGEHVPFASIVIQGTNKGGSTNINGFFLITNIPIGVYQVAVSSVGYIKHTSRAVVRSGETTTLDISLAPEAVEFQEVVITEQGKKELTEINTSVHIMEQKDFRAVPVTVQADVFRTIQILPGVISTSDVNSHFYVRGGGGDQNLILLDGMKIYNPYHAFGIFSVFDADLIKNTEVYTGAFPPGFGGRLSSVLNMTTRDGSSKRLSGRANINFVSAKAQVEGPLLGDSGFHWLVSGRKSLFNESLSKFLKRDVPVSFYDLFFKATREVNESHARYGLEGFYSGDDMLGSGLEDPDYHWRNHAVGFVTGGLVQDRIYVDAVMFDNLFEAQRVPHPGSSVRPTSTSIQEPGIRANLTLYTDSKDLYFFGFEFSFPKLQYNVVNNFGNARSLSHTGVESFAWFRYQTSMEPFQFDGGFHVDAASLLNRRVGLQAFQPRLNVSYRLTEYWKLKGSYGRFTQDIVTVNSEDDIISIFDAWIAVPDYLPLERSDHYILGVDGPLLENLSLSVQAYYKDFPSLVAFNQGKVDNLDPDFISATGNSYGTELLLRYGVPQVDLYASYTLGVATVHNATLTYHPRYDRRHSFNALATVHVDENLDLSARWEVGSGFPYSESVGYYDRLTMGDAFSGGGIQDETGSPYLRLGAKNASRLPSYHRLDLSASYRFRIGPLKSALGLNIINAYDHDNLFYVDRKTGKEVFMLPFFPTVTLNIEY